VISESVFNFRVCLQLPIYSLVNLTIFVIFLLNRSNLISFNWFQVSETKTEPNQFFSIF
jgi:hypothetical protein